MAWKLRFQVPSKQPRNGVKPFSIVGAEKKKEPFPFASLAGVTLDVLFEKNKTFLSSPGAVSRHPVGSVFQLSFARHTLPPPPQTSHRAR